VGMPGLRNTAHSLFLTCFLFPAVSQAAHPLITEDTGTQGTGRFQLELTAEHGYRDEDHAAAWAPVCRHIFLGRARQPGRHFHLAVSACQSGGCERRYRNAQWNFRRGRGYQVEIL
jgi:hypothetical protein